MLTLKDLETGRRNTWCPGCGNFGILKALKDALVRLNIEQEKVVMVAGIGCSGTITNYVKVNTFHTLHGRVLPVATGIKLSNPELIVIGHAGDGDAYAIGSSHLIHAARRNIDITYIVHNNMVYGLTTGQTSPTSPVGMKSKTTPFGSFENPVNPIALGIASGATFVARGYAGRPKHLSMLIEEAIKHRGFALIDVLQPCVTWDRERGYAWYNERVYELEEENHDYTDKNMAYAKAYEWGDKIPIGIFYWVEEPTLEDRLPQLDENPSKADLEKITIKDIIEEMI